MPEPITLTTVGIVALTQGVRFLYAQAGEFLAQWRRRKEASAAPESTAVSTTPVPPGIFDGPLALGDADLSVLDTVGKDMLTAKKELANIVDGSSDVDVADETFLRNVQLLRWSMEQVLGHRITFVGENRAPTGSPVVRGEVDVDLLKASEAVGADVGDVVQGTVEGKAFVRTASDNSKVVGTRAGTIGAPSRRSEL